MCNPSWSDTWTLLSLVAIYNKRWTAVVVLRKLCDNLVWEHHDKISVESIHRNTKQLQDVLFTVSCQNRATRDLSGRTIAGSYITSQIKWMYS